MKGRRWSDTETLYLRKNWKKVDQDVLIKHLGRAFPAIAAQAKKMNLPGPYYHRDKNADPPQQIGVIWRKSIYPNILVSETGEVWNTKKAKMMKVVYRGKVAVVQLMINRKLHCPTVPRLVYETFKGPVQKGYVVARLDRNPLNNDLGNLFLVTRSNLSRKVRSTSLCKKVVVYEKGKPVRVYPSAKDYAAKHFIGYRSLIAYLNGEVKKSWTVQEDVRYAK